MRCRCHPPCGPVPGPDRGESPGPGAAGGRDRRGRRCGPRGGACAPGPVRPLGAPRTLPHLFRLPRGSGRIPAVRSGPSRPTAPPVTMVPSRRPWSGVRRPRRGPAISDSRTVAMHGKSPRRTGPIPPSSAAPVTRSAAPIACGCSLPWWGTASTATASGPRTSTLPIRPARPATCRWCRRSGSPQRRWGSSRLPNRIASRGSPRRDMGSWRR